MEVYTLRVQQCQGKTAEQPGIAEGDEPRALHSQRDHAPSSTGTRTVSEVAIPEDWPFWKKQLVLQNNFV